MKIIKFINQDKVATFLEQHKDKSIQEVYDFIRSIKVRNRTTEQHIVYTYLFMNKKKLGIK